jgi:hypothetical protein
MRFKKDHNVNTCVNWYYHTASQCEILLFWNPCHSSCGRFNIAHSRYDKFSLFFSSLIFQKVLMELIWFKSKTFAIRVLMENRNFRYIPAVGSSDSKLWGQKIKIMTVFAKQRNQKHCQFLKNESIHRKIIAMV